MNLRTLSGQRIEKSRTGATKARWARHFGLDLKALAKRRAKNKFARASRRINRQRAH